MGHRTDIRRVHSDRVRWIPIATTFANGGSKVCTTRTSHSWKFRSADIQEATHGFATCSRAGESKYGNELSCALRPRGSVQKRPSGVSSKPANGSGPEQLDVVPGHRLSIKLNRNFFLRSSKKSCSGARGRIFSRSPMVLVTAFPTPGVQSATWFSSSAAHI